MLTLCDPDFEKKLLVELQRQQHLSLFCDVVLQIEDMLVMVHSCLLSAHSPVLLQHLGAAPGAPSPRRQWRIDLEGVTPRGLQTVVSFLYSGEVRCEGESELREVLSAARALGIRALEEMVAGGGVTPGGKTDSWECTPSAEEVGGRTAAQSEAERESSPGPLESPVPARPPAAVTDLTASRDSHRLPGPGGSGTPAESQISSPGHPSASCLSSLPSAAPVLMQTLDTHERSRQGHQPVVAARETGDTAQGEQAPQGPPRTSHSMSDTPTVEAILESADGLPGLGAPGHPVCSVPAPTPATTVYPFARLTGTSASVVVPSAAQALCLPFPVSVLPLNNENYPPPPAPTLLWAGRNLEGGWQHAPPPVETGRVSCLYLLPAPAHPFAGTHGDPVHDLDTGSGREVGTRPPECHGERLSGKERRGGRGEDPRTAGSRSLCPDFADWPVRWQGHPTAATSEGGEIRRRDGRAARIEDAVPGFVEMNVGRRGRGRPFCRGMGTGNQGRSPGKLRKGTQGRRQGAGGDGERPDVDEVGRRVGTPVCHTGRGRGMARSGGVRGSGASSRVPRAAVDKTCAKIRLKKLPSGWVILKESAPRGRGQRKSIRLRGRTRAQTQPAGRCVVASQSAVPGLKRGRGGRGRPRKYPLLPLAPAPLETPAPASAPNSRPEDGDEQMDRLLEDVLMQINFLQPPLSPVVAALGNYGKGDAVQATPVNGSDVGQQGDPAVGFGSSDPTVQVADIDMAHLTEPLYTGSGGTVQPGVLVHSSEGTASARAPLFPGSSEDNTARTGQGETPPKLRDILSHFLLSFQSVVTSPEAGSWGGGEAVPPPGQRVNCRESLGDVGSVDGEWFRTEGGRREAAGREGQRSPTQDGVAGDHAQINGTGLCRENAVGEDGLWQQRTLPDLQKSSEPVRDRETPFPTPFEFTADWAHVDDGVHGSSGQLPYPLDAREKPDPCSSVDMSLSDSVSGRADSEIPQHPECQCSLLAGEECVPEFYSAAFPTPSPSMVSQDLRSPQCSSSLLSPWMELRLPEFLSPLRETDCPELSSSHRRSHVSELRDVPGQTRTSPKPRQLEQSGRDGISGPSEWHGCEAEEAVPVGMVPEPPAAAPVSSERRCPEGEQKTSSGGELGPVSERDTAVQEVPPSRSFILTRKRSRELEEQRQEEMETLRRCHRKRKRETEPSQTLVKLERTRRGQPRKGGMYTAELKSEKRGAGKVTRGDVKTHGLQEERRVKGCMGGRAWDPGRPMKRRRGVPVKKTGKIRPSRDAPEMSTTLEDMAQAETNPEPSGGGEEARDSHLNADACPDLSSREQEGLEAVSVQKPVPIENRKSARREDMPGSQVRNGKVCSGEPVEGSPLTMDRSARGRERSEEKGGAQGVSRKLRTRTSGQVFSPGADLPVRWDSRAALCVGCGPKRRGRDARDAYILKRTPSHAGRRRKDQPQIKDQNSIPSAIDKVETGQEADLQLSRSGVSSPRGKGVRVKNRASPVVCGKGLVPPLDRKVRNGGGADHGSGVTAIETVSDTGSAARSKHMVLAAEDGVQENRGPLEFHCIADRRARKKGVAELNEERACVWGKGQREQEKSEEVRDSSVSSLGGSDPGLQDMQRKHPTCGNSTGESGVFGRGWGVSLDVMHRAGLSREEGSQEPQGRIQQGKEGERGEEKYFEESDDEKMETATRMGLDTESKAGPTEIAKQDRIRTERRKREGSHEVAWKAKSRPSLSESTLQVWPTERLPAPAPLQDFRATEGSSGSLDIEEEEEEVEILECSSPAPLPCHFLLAVLRQNCDLGSRDQSEEEEEEEEDRELEIDVVG
nr:PREDICTED: BTB/POZ domain-containing protein 18 [Lepisosteus oculatus]XP_015209405.1 PREDICTED: BTB/POZ domain-containing protein 18 [Lepisosteus oculatus]XP_015209406.1 PREDICTED: BTB/POZ domain-containing protein 18 [Lepisosteus oculatus]XP_015209407.1 PREDICTED: BTB/POZ domain-containing protein 18 [Lepisosteus oculatus]XP_015209408.1 PREDICTED: BTB/POZ domain-containing protein 18 [Lepisosteus oculatus]XP_015209409.1 PREDICTED: BTB/POZ domain-containing protein 18 [Lepisosteus oculatus]